MPVITTADLIDRIFREYFEPPDEQPAVGRLNADITDVASAFVYTAGSFLPEDESLLGENVIVEINRELMGATVVDTGTQTVTVERQKLGTTAAAHTAGDVIKIAPNPSRQQVFDNLADSIAGLNGQLFRIRTTELTSDEPFAPAPVDCLSVIRWRYRPTVHSGVSVQWIDGAVEFLDGFEPSSTNKAIQFLGVGAGLSGYLTYRAKFIRPTINDETEDIELDLGIKPEWEQLVIVGAVSQVLGVGDLAARTQEYITESLATVGFPTGAGERLRNSMIQYHELLLQRAKASQHTEADGGITVTRQTIII